MSKPKIAFFDFTSCEGCQLTVVDSLQTHLDLLEAVEIVQFREAMTDAPRGEDYQIAFIEGSCARKPDEERLTRIRERAATVVALGACAHLGGVNAIRNGRPLEEVTSYVYDSSEWAEEPPPRRPRLNDYILNMSPLAQPIEAIIKVDAVLPGCPIDREEFVRVTKQLLQGRRPTIPDYPMCVECKLKENVCVFHRGGECLGPIARAGCGAICPTYGDGCEGCRGIITNPNFDEMNKVLEEAGRAMDDTLRGARFTLFNTVEMARREPKTEGMAR